MTRLPLRRAAGETLLALGLPQEAQSLLGLAPGEDPQAATDPHLAALTAMAALLSGRLPQAMALRSVTLPDTDELTFWRSALAAALGDARAAAPGLAATMPLLFDYPEGLRNRLLPMVALALAEAENPAALHRLLERAGPSPDLALPRAIIAESEGRVDAALAEYDQLAEGRDRRSRARGLRRAIELRLATGRLDAGQAARALGATLLHGAMTRRKPAFASGSPPCAKPPAMPAAPWPCCGRPRLCSPIARPRCARPLPAPFLPRWARRLRSQQSPCSTPIPIAAGG
ncbi:hypothetical protein ACFQY5_29320 [Paeniroseomonas aquatica]|uniref:hypothetical protein n=1 Tax=Paeniroseomonas aquatica TaxID=373043 RepID=UPI0036215256